MALIRINTSIKRLNLDNPTMLASGIWGVSKESVSRVLDAGAGAAVIKSISKEPREGHHNPSVIQDKSYLLNAIGYSNQGIKEAKKEFSDLHELKPVIASVIGKTPEEFAEAASLILEDSSFSAIELPLSCPHTPGYGTMAGQTSPENTYKITEAVRNITKLPLFIKLSPNTEAIGDAARQAQEAGADAITMGNSLGPGMRISIEAKKPVLAFKFGGVSGPAIFPVMLRSVYDVYSSVDIPVIGCGGILSGRDALEMMMAGATAIQIGSAIYYEGLDVFSRISEEMRDWLKKEGYKDIKEIIGVAHE